MATTPPGCCDSQWQLLFKIADAIANIAPAPTPPTLVTLGLESGSQAIANGAGTVSVVFPTPFASVPNVVVSVSRPAAEDLIFANIDQASITTTGFTATLSNNVASANYKLNWIATV